MWKQEYDPEFSKESVGISRSLKEEYQRIAQKKKVHFLAASDYASPSTTDMEHMDELGHARLAQAILDAFEQII